MIDHGTRSFSYSAWVKHGPLGGSYDQPFDAGGLFTGHPGFAFEYTSSDVRADLSDETNHTEIPFIALPPGWTHLVAVVDRPNAKVFLYANGVRTTVATISLTGSITSLVPICFAGQNGYTGLVDEVRVYTEALTPEWIAAEYENVTQRSTFVSIGAVE